jgi:AcrR family transcriptional regulator
MYTYWVVVYTEGVPRLWTETIQTHRQSVRDAILQTAAALVAKSGLRSVTMSHIAEQAGIGRATLYKYFADVESILSAWHERQIAQHLEHLTKVGDEADTAGERLLFVLEALGLHLYETRGPHNTELAAFLHRDQRLVRAQGHLNDLLQDLLKEGVREGVVRDDVAPNELANYCTNSLAAARTLRSKAALHRLVKVILAGLGAPAAETLGHRHDRSTRHTASTHT